jgi:putative transposase
MRLTAAEKEEIILLVERSDLGVNRTLKQVGIHKSTFYNWYKAWGEKGADGLKAKAGHKRQQWNTIPQKERNLVVEVALEYPHLSSREISCKLIDTRKVFISESSVYRILKAQGLITSPAYILMAAANEFSQKPNFVHEMWQTDFTYFKILGWGWYYLSTIMDDYSRFIIHHEICKTMQAQDVQRCVERALQQTGLSKKARPKLLSDNGACYIAADLKEYLEKELNIRHIHGRPLHPQTQGKIERYHRSMKNVVKLDNYYSPEQLKKAIDDFVHYYNYERYHESLGNMTPADFYFGRQEKVMRRRSKIKLESFKRRRTLFQRQTLINRSMN